MTDLLVAWIGLICLCLGYGALTDIAARTIPNSISFAVVVLAVPLRLSANDLGRGVIFAVIVFGILCVVWALGRLGGGDVKLWAACSLLVPADWLAQTVFSMRVVLLGGLVAVVYLCLRWIGPEQLDRSIEPGAIRRDRLARRVWRIERWRARRGGSIPYGVAIAAAAVATVVSMPHGGLS